jgi:NAD(P)-dependent dehydrogenase (short-subunit alcohol dehydrogenase family)
MALFTSMRIIVTGTASGIGASVAEALVAGGAEVTSLDRNDPAVHVARHIPVDLSRKESIAAAVDALDGEYQALINVAGVPGTLPGDVVLAVNFLGMRELTEAATPKLVRGGSIVIVSSTAGFRWPERLPQILDLLGTKTFAEGADWFAANPQEGNAYDFSKEVATVYAHRKAIDLLPVGIRINAVLPGPVETPILGDFEESMGKDLLDGVRAFVGRHGTPADVAGAVTFLATDQARWVNGEALVVDGGLMGAVMTGLFVPATAAS